MISAEVIKISGHVGRLNDTVGGTYGGYQILSQCGGRALEVLTETTQFIGFVQSSGHERHSGAHYSAIDDCETIHAPEDDSRMCCDCISGETLLRGNNFVANVIDQGGAVRSNRDAQEGSALAVAANRSMQCAARCGGGERAADPATTLWLDSE